MEFPTVSVALSRSLIQERDQALICADLGQLIEFAAHSPHGH